MEIKDIKCNLRMRSEVKYGGHAYYLVACRLRYDRQKNKFIYDAELLDERANSKMVVPLESVEVMAE